MIIVATSPRRIVTGLSLAVILAGCGSHDPLFDKQGEIIKQSNELISRYLNSEATQAEECLREQAALLERATVLEPSGRAQLLSLTFFRLYVLQERLGNPDAAEAALVKARYWLLERSELGREPLATGLDRIRQLSPDKIRQEVDQLDRKQNHGNPAEYTQSIK